MSWVPFLPILIVALGAAGAHLGVLGPEPGFRVAMTGALLGLPALLVSAWSNGVLTPPTLVNLLPLAALGALGLQAISHPFLRDVSTHPADPPRIEAPGALVLGDDVRTMHGDRSERLLTAEKRHQHLMHLNGRVVEGTTADWAPKLKAMLEARGWPVTLVEEGERLMVHAVATSQLFRFADDVLVRARPEGEGKLRVDVRSASRVGESDLGANATRVRAVLADLDALGAKDAGPTAATAFDKRRRGAAASADDAP